MEFELHEMSSGITAWRTIAFALERDLPFPIWVRSYLEQVASGIDDWAMLNGHPGELKDILHLHGSENIITIRTTRAGFLRLFPRCVLKIRRRQSKA